MSKGLKAFLTEQVVEKGKGKAKLAVVDKTLGSRPLSYSVIIPLQLFLRVHFCYTSLFNS